MPGSDYARIEKAIHYLDTHVAEQPALTDVAGHVGLSPFHFQRMFHRWAGVTPKSFLQYATLVRAKRLLSGSESLLQSSLDVGLSGAGRLHDLFVTIEAMTPGEFKTQGRSLVVRWGVHPTPFGEAVFAATDRGLCGLAFTSAADYLRDNWPDATLRHDPAFTRPFALELSARVRGQPTKPLSLLLKGTPFQLRVWEALLRVPEGAVVTYGQLAEQLEIPSASRAVGSAVGANLIAYLVPCHRVIRSTGALGGYAWGPDRKRAMLAIEHSRRSA